MLMRPTQDHNKHSSILTRILKIFDNLQFEILIQSSALNQNIDTENLRCVMSSIQSRRCSWERDAKIDEKTYENGELIKITFLEAAD